MSELCHCATPDPTFVVTGGMHFDPLCGVWDDIEEHCYCARCGGTIIPDMILADMPELEDIEF
jgi:hypothetical protein